MLAAAAAALGFAYDAGSGNNELSVVFSICYVGGCVLAVLAVRQSGVFTAVIQPPLILFVIVPAAYFVFHGSSITGIKDILINCGYPLIERFPLMFFTSAAVLVIGLVRWYIALSARRAAPKDGEPEAADGAASQAAETTTSDAVEAAPRRRRREHSLDRPARAATSAAAPRKHRASPGRHPGPPRRRGHPAHAMRVPRRPRSPSRARTVPGDARRPPVAAVCRTALRRPQARPAPGRPANHAATRPRSTPAARTNGPSARSDPVLPNVRNVVAGQRHPSRTSRYDPFEPRSTNGSGGTHHPVSRVRYRGADDGESNTEHRTRPRRPRYGRRFVGVRRLTATSGWRCGQAGSRAAARTPTSRWPS